MTRKTETVSRRDWDIIVADLRDGDLQATLQADMARWEWPDGAGVQYTTDATGAIDSESSPRPLVSSDDEAMRDAAARSLDEDRCMFCGEETEDLTSQEDWDGNEGRACPSCRDAKAAERDGQ